MTKIAIQSDQITPFGGIFWVMQQFDRSLSQVIDSTLGVRCKFYGYQYSEILRSLMCIYFFRVFEFSGWNLVIVDNPKVLGLVENAFDW